MRCRADLAAGASLSVQYECCTSSSEISAAWIGSSLSQKVKVRGMHIIYGMVDSTRESVRLSMGLGCVAWFRLMRSTFGKLTSAASMYGGVTCVQRERETVFVPRKLYRRFPQQGWLAPHEGAICAVDTGNQALEPLCRVACWCGGFPHPDSDSLASSPVANIFAAQNDRS
jgi:hypothetical protein